MLFEFFVPLRSPSPLKSTKRHSRLPRSTVTTSMMRWSLPLPCKLGAPLSIPKTFTMARRLMGNSQFETPSLDHSVSGLYDFKSREIYPSDVRAAKSTLFPDEEQKSRGKSGLVAFSVESKSSFA